MKLSVSVGHKDKRTLIESPVMLRPLIALLSLLLLIGCGEVVTSGTKDARILLMGDSMMAANRGSGQSVADGIERQLGEEVIDRSVYAARMIYILPISGAAGLRLRETE